MQLEDVFGDVHAYNLTAFDLADDLLVHGLACFTIHVGLLDGLVKLIYHVWAL